MNKTQTLPWRWSYNDPILQIRKLRCREIKWLAEGRPTAKRGTELGSDGALSGVELGLSPPRLLVRPSALLRLTEDEAGLRDLSSQSSHPLTCDLRKTRSQKTKARSLHSRLCGGPASGLPSWLSSLCLHFSRNLEAVDWNYLLSAVSACPEVRSQPQQLPASSRQSQLGHDKNPLYHGFRLDGRGRPSPQLRLQQSLFS